jgi:hypothetical protein
MGGRRRPKTGMGGTGTKFGQTEGGHDGRDDYDFGRIFGVGMSPRRASICRAIQRNEQATYRLLRLARLPATRTGDRWVASAAKLKRALTGERP